jgi:hypothetical protein
MSAGTCRAIGLLVMVTLAIHAPRGPGIGPARRGRYIAHDVAMCVQCHTRAMHPEH